MQENNDTVVVNKSESKSRVVVNVIGAALCVILLPILILNCILIVKGMAHPNDVPSIGGKVPLIVLTGSMEDEINKGDLIFCEKIEAKDVKVGDVISFFDPAGNGSTVVTHRVTRVDEDPIDGSISFRVQGDANDFEDRLPVPAENVIGIWKGQKVALIGYLMVFSQSTWGLVVCLVLPIAAFVLYEVLSRRKHDKSKQSEVDALKAELEALKNAKGEDTAQPQEAPTQEEPKAEEPKVEQVKEAPTQEEPKAEEPKAEEPKA